MVAPDFGIGIHVEENILHDEGIVHSQELDVPFHLNIVRRMMVVFHLDAGGQPGAIRLAHGVHLHPVAHLQIGERQRGAVVAPDFGIGIHKKRDVVDHQTVRSQAIRPDGRDKSLDFQIVIMGQDRLEENQGQEKYRELPQHLPQTLKMLHCSGLHNRLLLVFASVRMGGYIKGCAKEIGGKALCL